MYFNLFPYLLSTFQLFCGIEYQKSKPVSLPRLIKKIKLITHCISWFCGFQKLPPNIEANAVFCNDQISLAEVDVYGFDYDYTLGKASLSSGRTHSASEIFKKIL